MFSNSFTSLSDNPENILSRSLAVEHIVPNYPYFVSSAGSLIAVNCRGYTREGRLCSCRFMNPDQSKAIAKKPSLRKNHSPDKPPLSSMEGDVSDGYPMNHSVMVPLAWPLVICKRQQPTLGACK
jgi:hypothetical protein